MKQVDNMLRSFGMDPLQVWQQLHHGHIDEVLRALENAEEHLELRRMELEDLREILGAFARQTRPLPLGALSDEDLETLSAAGPGLPEMD